MTMPPGGRGRRLVPCPLTVFAMMCALSCDGPEAQLPLALAMLSGFRLNLGAVAVATVLAWAWLMQIRDRYGAPVEILSRFFDGAAGAFFFATRHYAPTGTAQFLPSGPFTHMIHKPDVE